MMTTTIDQAGLTRRDVLRGGVALGIGLGFAGTQLAATIRTEARPHPTEVAMNTLTTTDGPTIFYKDWGPKDAQPIMFHHGWPLSADDWDNQMLYFLDKGFRVIAHDRRGHGRSTQTDGGNEMDAYASDVADLVAA